MSRHYFDTEFHNHPVRVVLGYDRPLNYFFLTIMYTDPVPAGNDTDSPDEDDAINEDDLIVYSNIDDPAAGFCQDFDYYRAKLTALGISVPASMFRETEQDAIHQVGNRQVRYHADGRIEEIG